MKKGWIILIVILLVLFLGYRMVVGKYNAMQEAKINVENAWSQVQNQYQRRFDLIPNLVNTVKGYAKHEQETLTAVTEARAKVGGVVNISPETINNPEAFAKFQQMQDGLSGALQRLMVSVERYPELKADENFIRLQDELAGTENRISVERMRYNDTVTVFNKMIIVFPNNIFANMFNIKKAEFFQAADTAQKAPEVNFN